MDNLTAIIISQFLKTKTKYYSRLHEDQIGFIYHPLWTCLLALIAKFECYRIFFQWTYCKFSIKPTLNNCTCTDANTHQGFPHHGKEHRMERFFPINQKFGLSPLTIYLVPLYYFYPEKCWFCHFHVVLAHFGQYAPHKPTPVGTSWTCMHAGKYIYVISIFLAQGIFWHNRTQSLCVTEELLYGSCERGFDLSQYLQVILVSSSGWNRQYTFNVFTTRSSTLMISKRFSLSLLTSKRSSYIFISIFPRKLHFWSISFLYILSTFNVLKSNCGTKCSIWFSVRKPHLPTLLLHHYI